MKTRSNLIMSKQTELGMLSITEDSGFDMRFSGILYEEWSKG